MGSSEDEEPEEAEKSKECLAAHGYTVGKTLGAGSYSTVKLVSKDGGSYACKIISKEKSSVIYRVKFLPRELKILGSTRHPHITQIYTIIEEPTKVFIIMEMACGGDLLEKILKVKRLDEKTTHQFFMQLASALAYLHKNDVAHRDLKCENVLLTTVDVVKLTDFSFARYCTDEHTKRKELSETFCGSEAYAAPEILQGICYLPKLADVWSLGVILYVMVTGLLPYESNGLLRQVRLQMTRTVRFPKVLPLSQELKNLIRGMLEPVVTLRASMGRVIRHPWIKRYPSPFKEHVYVSCSLSKRRWTNAERSLTAIRPTPLSVRAAPSSKPSLRPASPSIADYTTASLLWGYVYGTGGRSAGALKEDTMAANNIDCCKVRARLMFLAAAPSHAPQAVPHSLYWAASSAPYTVPCSSAERADFAAGLRERTGLVAGNFGQCNPGSAGPPRPRERFQHWDYENPSPDTPRKFVAEDSTTALSQSSSPCRGAGIGAVQELLHGPNVFSQTSVWMLRSGVQLASDTVIYRQKLRWKRRDELVSRLGRRLETQPLRCCTSQGSRQDPLEQIELRGARDGLLSGKFAEKMNSRFSCVFPSKR
ncbi:hypothetical protein HPB52_008790 [Rhipicephalus sanguineus]|uniref:Protein kinase domain-containing protein n=1 Tax=Rhipicephalus sanguineus TaxID=34632 RepID=A0A9D4SY48_RHISA|nr:hypothetical protein HPB52_008790 [Rhipicephalus sanguineus]